MMQRDKSTSEATEPSSSMVALRTIVIIAFLVAIPLMAVFGTGLPTSLRTAMQGKAAETHFGSTIEPKTKLAANPASLAEPSSTTDHQRPAERAAALETAASFAENLPLAGGPDAALPSGDFPPSSEAAPRASITGVRTIAASPRAQITQVRAVREAQVLSAPAPAPTAPLWTSGPRTAASPRVRSKTAHFETSAVPRREVPSSSAPSFAPKRSSATGGWQATAYSQSAQDAAPRSADNGAAAEANDPFARGERQLRKYGATHYRLESWGDEGELFRCSANVSLPNHLYGARHFEATAANPSQAVERLLEKVEAWRAAQRP